jgi:hypothetical protein
MLGISALMLLWSVFLYSVNAILATPERDFRCGGGQWDLPHPQSPPALPGQVRVCRPSRVRSFSPTSSPVTPLPHGVASQHQRWHWVHRPAAAAQPPSLACCLRVRLSPPPQPCPARLPAGTWRAMAWWIACPAAQTWGAAAYAPLGGLGRRSRRRLRAAASSRCGAGAGWSRGWGWGWGWGGGASSRWGSGCGTACQSSGRRSAQGCLDQPLVS